MYAIAASIMICRKDSTSSLNKTFAISYRDSPAILGRRDPSLISQHMIKGMLVSSDAVTVKVPHCGPLNTYPCSDYF